MRRIPEYERIRIEEKKEAVGDQICFAALLGCVAAGELMLQLHSAKKFLGRDEHAELVNIATTENTSLLLALASKWISNEAMTVVEAVLSKRENTLAAQKTKKAKVEVFEGDIQVAEHINSLKKSTSTPVPKTGCYIMEKEEGSKTGVGGLGKSKLLERIKGQEPGAYIVAISFPGQLDWTQGESEEKRLFRRLLLDAFEALLTILLGGGQGTGAMSMTSDPRSDPSAAGASLTFSLSPSSSSV